jgi:hypothetical protein
MSNAALLNTIAIAHAMSHANKKESWTCECLACKFTKEEATFAEVLLDTLKQQGYETSIPEPMAT